MCCLCLKLLVKAKKWRHWHWLLNLLLFLLLLTFNFWFPTTTQGVIIIGSYGWKDQIRGLNVLNVSKFTAKALPERCQNDDCQLINIHCNVMDVILKSESGTSDYMSLRAIQGVTSNLLVLYGLRAQWFKTKT